MCFQRSYHEKNEYKTIALRASTSSGPLSDIVSNLVGGKSLLAENPEFASLKQKQYN